MNVALNSTSNKRNGESFSLVRILHLWHLLSLDAPSVADLWTWFIAATLRARIPRFVPCAMFLMVWILYVGDRLLDGRRCNLQPFGAEHHLPKELIVGPFSVPRFHSYRGTSAGSAAHPASIGNAFLNSLRSELSVHTSVGA
jgi:hypothetical protein